MPDHRWTTKDIPNLKGKTALVTGANIFVGNGLDGLYTYSHGNIVLNSVYANNNGGTGVYGSADGKILISCGSMTGNTAYGWEFWVPSTQTVTLKGVFAYGNNGGAGNTKLDGGTLVTSLSCP